MSPLNEFIYEKSIERQIQLLRHREGLARRVRIALTAHDKEFTDKLAVRVLRLSKKDFKRLATAAGWDTEALKELRELIKSLSSSSALVLKNTIDSELDSLTLSEYDFYKDMFETGGSLVNETIAVSALSLSSAKKYRDAEVAVGQTQGELISGWAARRRRKLLQVIRSSAINQDVQLMISEVGGTDSRFGGILRATHHGGVLIANTLHPAATTAGSEALRQENKGAFDLVWSSILDSRTSSVCFSRHNKRIYRDLGGSKPPAHMNCRSRVVPIFGQDDEFPQETVKAWFSRQPEGTQRNILGKTRYEAYKKSASNLSFPRDFISRSGDRLTIKELIRRGKISVA